MLMKYVSKVATAFCSEVMTMMSGLKWQICNVLITSVLENSFSVSVCNLNIFEDQHIIAKQLICVMIELR